MKKALTIGLVTALSLTLTHAAENECEYPVYRMSSPIIIDGRLDEEAWNCLPEATGFRRLSFPKVFTSKRTVFRAGWDAEFLYIGVKCIEPDIGEVKSVMKDGENLWAEDSVEIFVRPAPPDLDHQIVVNTVGSRNWLGGKTNLETKASVGSLAWTAEVKIPFKELGRTPKKNTKWSFNIARNITVGNDSSDRYTTWSPLEGCFHDFDHFGGIIFSLKELKMDEAEKISMGINMRQVKPFIEKAGKVLAKCRSHMDEMRKEAALSALPMMGEFEKNWSSLNAAVSRKTLTLQESLDVERQSKELLNAIVTQHLMTLVSVE